MGKSGLLYIWDQMMRQLPIVHKAIVIPSSPRSQMNLIDGYGGVLPVVLFASIQPLRITPFMAALGRYDRSGIRAELELVAIGISFKMHMSLLVQDLEFIVIARLNPWYEYLPYTSCASGAHWIYSAIPAVEVADYTCSRGVGCPYGKKYSVVAIYCVGVSTKKTVGVPVIALAE